MAISRPPDTPVRRLDGGAVGFGLLLIVIGVVLTLDNLEVVSASELLAGWWPAAVIALGLWTATTGSALVGLLMVAVGGVLLLSTLEVVTTSVGPLIVPGVLVVVGGTLLQAGRRVRAAQTGLAEALDRGRPAEVGDAAAAPAATAILGDAQLVVDDAVPATGRIVVSATSVLGNVRIEVPAGWRLEDRITRVLGDVHLPRQAGHPDAPVVELHGVVLLGDVKVTERASARGAS